MRRTLLLPFLILLAFAVYGSTLSGGFLGDDYSLMGLFHQSAEEPVTQEPQWTVVEAGFFQKVSGTQVPKFYRPLWFLSLYLDHKIFGLWSPAFRIHNLLLFAFSAFFLACFIQALTGNRYLSLSSSLLFVVLPTNYASVLWIADRTGQLSVFFSTLCLWLFLLSLQKKSRGYLGLAFLASVGAILSKETSLVLFPLMFLLCLGHGRKLEPCDRRRVWWKFLPFVLLLLAYFPWRHYILGTWLGGARNPANYSLLDMVWNQFGVALSLLVPVRWPSMGPGFFWPAVVLALGLLGGGLYLRRRREAWWPFFLCWFVLSLLPNALDSSLPGAQRNLRFTFPSSLPFVILLVLSLQGWAAVLRASVFRASVFRDSVRVLRIPLMGVVLALSLGLLIHNRSFYVESGRMAPEITERVLNLARIQSTKGVIVHGLPAWHGNAPLMLNAGPFLLHPPFLAEAKRPFLVYPDGDMGQLYLLRDASRFLQGGDWHALRWDPLRQTLIPAPLPRFVDLRGRLERAKPGHLVFVRPGERVEQGLRVRFSRVVLSPYLDRKVQVQALIIETPRGDELLVGEVRGL